MFRIMCKSKIHSVQVTQTKLEYEGSITIDEEILREADILPGERVDVFNLSNGARFTTYAISGEAGSGIVCVNGAAARLAQVGDRVIVISYSLIAEEEISDFKMKVVLIGDGNRIVKKMER